MAEETTGTSLEQTRSRVNPLYKQIAEVLRQEIKTGYTPDQTLPPQRTLAKRFNASYFTVGNAIKELVHEGLVTRNVGSGTKVCDPLTARRGLVGILTTTNDPVYLSEIFSRAEAELRQGRFRPILYGGSHNYEDEKQAFHEIGGLNEAGVIIYSFFHDRFVKQIRDFLRQGIQCIAILRPIEGLDCIRVDHRMVGMLQAQYVAHAGWRKVLYIGRDSPEYASLQLEGFLAGASDAGLSSADFRVQSVERTENGVGDMAERRMVEQISELTRTALKKEVPEVVVTFGDRYLLPICEVLRDHGLAPGKDVQLVGADNRNLPRLSYVSVDHRHGQIGEQAARRLIDRIDGKRTGPPCTITVLPRLVKHV